MLVYILILYNRRFPTLQYIAITLTNNKLDWQALLPNCAPYEALFHSASQQTPASMEAVQLRLHSGLQLFCRMDSRQPFMLLKAEECDTYLSALAESIHPLLPKDIPQIGGNYQIEQQKNQLATLNRGPFHT